MRSPLSLFFAAAAALKIIDMTNALQRAASGGRTRRAAALLDAGADIHGDNDYSLRIASFCGHTETAELLLREGADPHANEGEALRWAQNNHHFATVRLLERWMTSTERPRSETEYKFNPCRNSCRTTCRGASSPR